MGNLANVDFCRRYKDKKDGAVEPEVDPERDQRTVFAYQVKEHASDICILNVTPMWRPHFQTYTITFIPYHWLLCG